MGGEGNDELFGGAGDDELGGNLGFDVLNGGTGLDEVRLPGDQDSYFITGQGRNFTTNDQRDPSTVANPNGTNTLFDVEEAIFGAFPDFTNVPLEDALTVIAFTGDVDDLTITINFDEDVA